MSVTQPLETPIAYDRIRAVEWQDGRIRLIDQRLLPAKLEYLVLETLAEAVHAIRDMAVRGAPAIGITAAYAVVLKIRDRFIVRTAKASAFSGRQTRRGNSQNPVARMAA